MKQFFFGAGPLLLVGGLLLWQQHQQTRLDTQLLHATALLEAENERNATQADNLLRGIRANVEKNRHPPADVARLREAEALHRRVSQVLADAHEAATRLRPATRRPRSGGQAIRQLGYVADSLRRLGPGAPDPPAVPSPPAASTAPEALADLTRLESQVWVGETRLLACIKQAVAYRRPVFKPIGLASAESSVVAPGATYHAELFLANHAPADLRQHMACNGRPVPIDSLGIGRVRFQAPTRPGPATWTGTIRTQLYGRDTTFVVRVPYRVAAR